MALNDNALTTVVKLQRYLADTSGDEVTTTVAEEDLINPASMIIELFCRKKLLATTRTEYYDGDGSMKDMSANFYPINSVAELNVDSSRAFGSGTEITSADYLIYSNEGRIELWNNQTAFAKGAQNIKLTYNAGFDSTVTAHAEKLEALDHACRVLCGLIWKDAPEGENRLGISSKSLSSDQVTGFIKKLPPVIQETLKAFKRLWK